MTDYGEWIARLALFCACFIDRYRNFLYDLKNLLSFRKMFDEFLKSGGVEFL